MNFYDSFYSGFGYDLSYFKDFNIVRGSIEDELVVIKFDEKEAPDVVNTAYKSLGCSKWFSFVV